MADVDKYRKGYEDQLKQDYDRKDESLAESFVKGLYRMPVEEAKRYFRNDDEQHGRDDAHFDKEFNPGDSKDDDSGVCFVTTACVTFAGLPDDCHELTTLRCLRDEYLVNLPNGRGMIAEYYSTAPRIVAAIQRCSQRDVILGNLFSEIREIVTDADAGRRDIAIERYRTLFRRLQELF